jgi:hypothetical protein
MPDEKIRGVIISREFENLPDDGDHINLSVLWHLKVRVLQSRDGIRKGDYIDIRVVSDPAPTMKRPIVFEIMARADGGYEWVRAGDARACQ